MADMRDVIIDRFGSMWDKVSVKSITMDTLASKCGISKKTIYKYFKSKDEIVSSIADDLFEEVRVSLMKLDEYAGEPDKAIYHLFQESYNIFGDVSDNRIRDIRSFYPEIEKEADMLIDEISLKFRYFFEKGVKKNLFRDINPFFIFMFYRAAADVVFKTGNILENGMTVKETISGFRELMFKGIIVK